MVPPLQIVHIFWWTKKNDPAPNHAAVTLTSCQKSQVVEPHRYGVAVEGDRAANINPCVLGNVEDPAV